MRDHLDVMLMAGSWAGQPCVLAVLLVNLPLVEIDGTGVACAPAGGVAYAPAERVACAPGASFVVAGA